MTGSDICQAICKNGRPCNMPAFTRVDGKWLCLVHHEHKIQRANKLRDQLFGPLPDADQDKD